MKRALIIIAQAGYQDVELDGTRKGLEEAGFTPVICSQEAGACTGKLGGHEHALIALADVDLTDYNRIIFIGGPGAAALADDNDAQTLAYKAAQKGLPLGAICIAPTILAKANVLSGKKATVWDQDGEQIALLEESGAIYTGDKVTIDGHIVTANGPDAAEEFGRIMASEGLEENERSVSI